MLNMLNLFFKLLLMYFYFHKKDKCARVISVFIYSYIYPSHEKFAVEKRQTKPQKPTICTQNGIREIE